MESNFLETGEDSGSGTSSIECRGPVRVANHTGFFLSLTFMLKSYVEFWCQRFLEKGEVSGPGTNSIECRGPVRVANHKGFSFYCEFSCCEFLSNSGVNVFSKKARSHYLGPIPSNTGDK